MTNIISKHYIHSTTFFLRRQPADYLSEHRHDSPEAQQEYDMIGTMP